MAMGIIILAAVSISIPAYPNDLTIEMPLLGSRDADDETMTVSFDMSWDNSWRNSRNYDAVWIFVKFSTDGGDTWEHATMSSAGENPSGFSGGYGTDVDLVVPSDKKGFFVRRAASGAGTVGINGMEFVWAWGEDGVGATDDITLKVFGVEMVYVPKGSFYAGDGDGVTESRYAIHAQGADNTKASITASDTDITCDNNANDDMDTSSVTVNGLNGIDGNTSYPNGYRAFYVMKYEVTEGEWVGFFNMLSSAEKLNRDLTSLNGKNSDAVVDRNTVSWSSGSALTTRADRACSYLSWADICAYADWAALRPMSELEYEKAARGKNIAPSDAGEYAWGDTGVTAATAINGVEDGTETISTQDANACYNDNTFAGGDGGTGPLRAGIFATSESTRHQAGAGYYGCMELSGNLWERCVSVGNAAGRVFQGTHGDGALTAIEGYEGNATNSDWPGYSEGQGVISSAGSGFKGGSWLETTVGRMAISDRDRASMTSSARISDGGGRCARTAE